MFKWFRILLLIYLQKISIISEEIPRESDEAWSNVETKSLIFLEQQESKIDKETEMEKQKKKLSSMRAEEKSKVFFFFF